MNEGKELFVAKLSAILNLLWGITDRSLIIKTAKAYIEYKHDTNIKLEEYLNNKLIIDLPDSWINALKTHSIFYSFCYGLFKLVPATILSQGFPVAVLMSEELKLKQIAYFKKLQEKKTNKREME